MRGRRLHLPVPHRAGAVALTQTVPCCWHRCPLWSTCQVTIPGPILVTFCALHERLWPIHVAAASPPATGSLLWVRLEPSVPPVVGWGVPGR